jgi:hypothetical protein
VLLFECVTGALPHAARTIADLVRRVVDDAPALNGDLQPEVHERMPFELGMIIGRCLRLPVDERFPDAAALRDALQRCDLAR